MSPDRELLCDFPCPMCASTASLYRGDLRSRDWLRYECDAGCWGDLAPWSIQVPAPFREPEPTGERRAP